MNIRRNIRFTLKRRKYKGTEILENLPIRMRVSFNSDRLDILTGYCIDSDKWDQDAQRVRKGYNQNNDRGSDINAYLNKASYEMDETFKEFEVMDRIPSKQEIEEEFLRRMKKGNKSSPKPKSSKASNNSRFWEAMLDFLRTESIKNSWQNATLKKFHALEIHIKAYKQHPSFEDFNEKGLTHFILVLKDKEGLSNSTILKILGLLKWFLKWALINKYHDVSDFEHYKPHLATTDKKVIFLTIEEIRQLVAAEIPPEKQYLERVRDVFVFCCFTGLRHSDVYNLRRSDIKDDRIDYSGTL